MEVASLYREFHKSLYSFIRPRVKTVEDAQDILQNVFSKITLNINTLSDKEKLQHWLFSITRNAIIDYYRINARKKSLPISDELLDRLTDESTPDSTHGLDRCLHHFVALLPDDYRDIIMDSEMNGVSQKELAKKHGMTYSSMRSRVQRGRERLKQSLQACCHIQSDRHGNILDVREKNSCGGQCGTEGSNIPTAGC